MYDLDKPGTKVIVAKGGEGGGPNNNWLGKRGKERDLIFNYHHFHNLSSKGQKVHIRLDLKLLADIGLVGFPNAGKSTLLKAISKARPKIAGYPFTTIKPNVGHIQYPDSRVITMADLPGLIEGAHYNVGMGHKYKIRIRI